MSESPTFRDIQKRTAQLVTFKDGLWDILLGSIFMTLAIYPVTREMLGPEWNFGLFMLVLAVLVIGQLVVRRYVSSPRIGYARSRRTKKFRGLLIVTAVFVLLTFGLVLITLLGPEAQTTSATPTASSVRGYTVEVLVVLIMAGIFSAMGYIFGVPRLYLYGWLIGLANLASVYLSHTAGLRFHLPTAVAAGVILLVGVVLLIRFLQNYPVQSAEI